MGFSRQDTGVGFYAILQGIFPTQGLNLHLSHLTCIGRRVFTTSTTREAQCDPTIASLGIHQTKLIQADTRTPMFIAALFTIAKNGNSLHAHQQGIG